MNYETQINLELKSKESGELREWLSNTTSKLWNAKGCWCAIKPGEEYHGRYFNKLRDRNRFIRDKHD